MLTCRFGLNPAVWMSRCRWMYGQVWGVSVWTERNQSMLVYLVYQIGSVVVCRE